MCQLFIEVTQSQMNEHAFKALRYTAAGFVNHDWCVGAKCIQDIPDTGTHTSTHV